LFQNLLKRSVRELHPQSTSRGRQKPTSLETQQTDHQPAAGSCLRCHVCTVKNKQTTAKFQSSKCKVGLCKVLFFRIYHTKVNFQIRLPSQCDICDIYLIIIIFCFISEIYKPFLEKDNFLLVKTEHNSMMYFLSHSFY